MCLGVASSSHYITSKDSSLRFVRCFSCGKSAGSPSEDYRWIPWSLGECRAPVLLTHSCLLLNSSSSPKEFNAAVGYRETVPTLALPLSTSGVLLSSHPQSLSAAVIWPLVQQLGSVNLPLAPLSTPGWINTAKGMEGNEHYLETALTGPHTHRVHLGFPTEVCCK